MSAHLHSSQLLNVRGSGAVTDEVAGELGRNVADLLADVGRAFLLDAGQKLCLDGHLQRHGEARVDLLKG